MTVAFRRVTFVRSSPELVFDRSLDVEFHLASMARSRERAIAGVTTGRLGSGDTVTWQAWHFGLRFRMTSRISAWDRPTMFVDEQVRGPFRWFCHLHTFEPIDGGTRMIDDVAYAAPLGPIGIAAERIVLGRYLEQLIDERNRALCHSFTTGD